MRVHRVLLIVSVMIGSMAIAWYGYGYIRDRADWEEVRKAALRVDSGLRHETLIALRSKVADLDAALTNYVAGKSNRNNESRVMSVRQAIESLEWAVEHTDSKFPIANGDEGFSFFRDRPYLIADGGMTCNESEGKLYLIRPTEMALGYAHAVLATPDQSLTTRTLDLSSAWRDCESKYETVRKKGTDDETPRLTVKPQPEKDSADPLSRRLVRYVHPCPNGEGQWCWSDPNDATFSEMPSPSKHQALEEAVQYANLGLAFKSDN